LTTTTKRGRYYYPFDGHTGKISVALLSQSRAVDSSRLHDKIGYVSQEDFCNIREALREVLGL
jgi:mRNA-degrading endonuclease toxin of MazEF toxin-antitoxin module